MTKNKQLFINMSAGVGALGISMLINFFLSPYIVASIGAEAYGFVQLSNNLLSYFNVLAIALNSMSSRFISISYFRDDIKEAKEYYSSTFFANLILVIVFMPIILVGIFNIERFLNISDYLLTDVKGLMTFLAANFLLTLICTNLGISFYVKNKLYILSLINIIGYVLRGGLLLLLYMNFEPHVAYMGMVTLIVTIFTQLSNLRFKKKLVPELSLQKRMFSWGKVKNLIGSGIWNTITRIGSLLQEGLDLLITNVMISAADMGVLAIAKTIPNLINNVLNTLISSFMPNLTELFAKGDKEGLKKDIKQSMKIIGMLINIPIALLIGFGDVLFSLWFPTQDANLLQILSILTIFPWAIMGQATIIHNIFTVVNKIKVNSILVCITGLLNVLVVFVLLKTTSFGLFAVAGVSSIMSILRNVIYTVPFGAIYIGCPWYTFFPEIVKATVSVALVGTISYVLKLFIPGISWIWLIIFAVAAVIIGLLFNFYLVLNKDDRKFIFTKIIRRKKNG